MASSEEQSGHNYAEWSTERLQDRLREIGSQWSDLRERFPSYPVCNVGASVPAEYREMQRLDRDRSEITTELSKRRKSQAGDGAPSPSSASSGGLESLDYPREFSPEARDRIEREKIRVSRELLPSSVYGFKDQDLGIRCIMRIFLAFAREACALRKEHGWTLDCVQREAEEFLRKLTITVVFAKFPGLDQHWISNWNGSISSDVERRFKASPQWGQYEELLLQSELSKSTGTGRLRTSANQAEPSPAQNVDKTADSGESKATNTNERASFVQPILDKKCWTTHEWSVQSGVDFHTADKYLKGTRRPYRSTRKKLADALGVAEQDLPK